MTYELKDYLKAINKTKEKLMDTNDAMWEKRYAPFIVNKCLAPFPDTVHLVNEMNISHHLDSKLQFDFLINIVPVSIFKHSTLGLNKKALSLNLIFQSDSKTLEDKVVNPIIDGIIEVVSKKFNAKLR